ncbi:MAG TPA: NAD(P)H-binding protein [Rhizomicrobium sp.]|nr:NAD(P)H-binding protein [Rhizomicrobium sp.]
MSQANSAHAAVGLLGATGAIGRSTAAALSARATPFRVIGRDEARLKAEFAQMPQAEFAVWNPGDPKAAPRALEGLFTIVHLLGVPYDRFKLHPILMRRVVEAAAAAGVKRILLIGTLYVFGRARTPRIDETHPRRPHTYKGRRRKEQEDILMQSGLAWSILRLPDFYGPGVESSYLHDIFAAAAEGRRANVIGPVKVPHEFVFVPDVGPVIAQMLETPAAFGHAWNLGGAGTITEYQVAQQAFGGKPKLRVAGKLLLRLAGLFNPLMRELVEMHYLMTDPLIVDDRALDRLLGGIRKTPYDDGIRQCMAAARKAKA